MDEGIDANMKATEQSKMNARKIQTVLRQHKQELHHKFGVSHIGLFGSYARGEADRVSDIDVVVELDNPDLFIMAALQAYLEDLFHQEVDVVRLRNNMNPRLKKQIQRDVLYV